MTDEVKKPKHQGKKTYIAAGALVVTGIAVALGLAPIDASPGAQGIAGTVTVILGFAVGFLRAPLARLEAAIEERTGFEIPDELVAQGIEKGKEELAEFIARKVVQSTAETPESPGTVIVRETS